MNHIPFDPKFAMPTISEQARATLAHVVLAELDRATAKFPTWPTDPLHAMGVLHEEVGELAKAVLQLVYEPHKSTFSDVRAEATQAAAMALRFLMSLDNYTWRPCEQHSQSTPAAATAAPSTP